MEQRINNQELPPLPFTYVRTHDPEKAVDEEWRISPASTVGSPSKPRADEENMMPANQNQKCPQ